jgi:hypothetical protein
VTAKRSPARNVIWRLGGAKRESLALLQWIYYSADVPCLARKRDIAASFLCLPRGTAPP